MMRIDNEPRIMVARPRAVPIPRPRMAFGPTRLNLLCLSCGAVNYKLKPTSEHSAACLAR